MGHETCELDLTRQEVAERTGTSHSFVSKLESGEHIPTSPVLKRILAVLDEQLLIGIERTAPGEEHGREIAPGARCRGSASLALAGSRTASS